MKAWCERRSREAWPPSAGGTLGVDGKKKGMREAMKYWEPPGVFLDVGSGGWMLEEYLLIRPPDYAVLQNVERTLSL